MLFVPALFAMTLQAKLRSGKLNHRAKEGEEKPK
jgi:hypothetical protein